VDRLNKVTKKKDNLILGRWASMLQLKKIRILIIAFKRIEVNLILVIK